MKTNIIKSLLLVLLIASIGVTQYYVVGFELHRFYAPSWFFIAAATMLLFSAGRERKEERWMLIFLLLLVVYLALRGIFSDVPSLTHKEFPVLFYGLVTFLAASTLAKGKKSLRVIGAFSIVLLLIQLCYNLIPAEETRNLVKAWGERTGQNGRMFGLFRHYNPFASYCGLSAGALIALAFIKWKTPFFKFALPILFCALSLFALYGAFKSGSRMGAAVTMFSIVFALFGGFSLRFLVKEGKLASPNKLMLVIGVGVLGVFLSAGLFTTAFNKVSEARGSKGDLSENVMGGMRISSIGMGFSLWLREPVIGSGPRSYSYHSPSLRRENSAYDKGNHGHPDAEMVHNDWIQTLAEYGVIGLILVLLSLGSILVLTWRNGWRMRGHDDSWFVAPLGASAAVAGIMIHSLGDFTMHSTPVFVHLSLILGCSLGWTSRGATSEISSTGSKLSYYLEGALVVVSLILFFTIGKKQIVNTPMLIKYDHTKWHKGLETNIVVAKEAVSKAPDSFMLQELGYNLLRKANTLKDGERVECLKEAEAVLVKGLEFHPYRIEILSNLARVKIELSKLEEAEALITEAFRWAGERWRVYHIGPLAESFLIKKADYYWDKRKSPQALACYLKAKEYNEKGFWQHYEGRDQVRKISSERINNNLKVLEMGRISPHEGMEFFNGYGL